MLIDDHVLEYWRRWQHVVELCCHRYAVKQHEVWDVKQDVFIRLLGAARSGKFDPCTTTTSTYLYQVARNVIWSGRNTSKSKHRRRATEYMEHDAPTTTTPHDVLVRKERHERLYRAADRLSPYQRAVFDALMDDLVQPELVERLDWNPNTIKTHRKRMNDNLHKLLTP